MSDASGDGISGRWSAGVSDGGDGVDESSTADPGCDQGGEEDGQFDNVPPGPARDDAESVQQAFGNYFVDPGLFTTPPTPAFEGIAVVGTTGTGTWEYELYNSTTKTLGAPQKMTKISTSNALLLGANDAIFFAPTSPTSFNGTASLVVEAWDGLPLHIRTSILALVDAATPRPEGGAR